MSTRPENVVIKVILVFAVFLSAVLPASRATADYVRIKGTVVNVRQGPGTTYQVLFQAKQGEEYDLLKTEGLWCLVSLDQGEEAWVFGRLVEILPGERISSKAVQPGAEVDLAPEHLLLRHFDKIAIVLFLLLVMILFWRRRRILDFTWRKLREVSGYRREQPFRYDNRNPKDDSWEI
jgi:uncharacterized protein YgiM (DUF1202 family)